VSDEKPYPRRLRVPKTPPAPKARPAPTPQPAAKPRPAAKPGPARKPGQPPIEAEATVETLVEGGLPLVTCHHCEHAVPSGDYCGHCGAHLALRQEGDRQRGFSYAAAPHEHVYQLNVITTLFPHLPHRRGHAFLWTLIAGATVLILLAGFHLFAAATAVAAFLLPTLYLLYLYEVEIYEHEPWQVVGATFAVGTGLGLIFSLIVGPGLSRTALSGDVGASVLLGGFALPLIAQALMLAGPLLLITREHFDDALDGLTFGAASALGFSLASMLVALWPILDGPLVGVGSALDWGLRLLRLGILVALVNATTTGLITASLWLYRHGRRRHYHEGWHWGLPASILVAFGSQIALGVLSSLISDLLVVVLLWIVGAAVLMLYLRLVIHHALLEEGAEHEIGPNAPCPECHRVVPTMLFCPACGVARSAAPKTGRQQVAG